MAQLKNLIVTGDARIAGNLYSNSPQIAVGTCSTAASTAAKAVTISDNSWELKIGNIIGVKFTNTNTASNCTLNVNNTGAKQVWYGSSANTGTSTTVWGHANRYVYYVYDGTYWVWLSFGVEFDTVPAAYCETAADTAAKTATHTKYKLLAKSYTLITIANANTASSAITLNINETGAKTIYINDVISSSSNKTLPAGSYIIYYDGYNYYFRTDGVLPQPEQSIYSTVYGGWHQYSDGDDLTSLESYSTSDYNAIKIGKIITYPSTTTSGAQVKSMIVRVESGYTVDYGSDKPYYYKAFAMGSGDYRTVAYIPNSTEPIHYYKTNPYAGGGVACFTAKTKVLTPSGLVNISEIDIDDEVISFNSTTNTLETKCVDKLVCHTTEELYLVDIGDEVIKTTWSHPFYVKDKGNTIAKCLIKGDLLKCSDNRYIEVKNIIRTEETIDVYEIRVKDNNNYFVGESSVLVYNEKSVIEDKV